MRSFSYTTYLCSWSLEWTFDDDAFFSPTVPFRIIITRIPSTIAIIIIVISPSLYILRLSIFIFYFSQLWYCAINGGGSSFFAPFDRSREYIIILYDGMTDHIPDKSFEKNYIFIYFFFFEYKWFVAAIYSYQT